jgi:orotate phosphoribosyltransferase
MEEVTRYLYNRPVDGKIIINDDIKKALDAYYAEYGIK